MLPAGTDPTGKDTTANIISVLIYSNHFGPEICVSPAEMNGRIKMDDRYQYEKPKAAVDPSKALWDPAFAADFTLGARSNFSYAHLLPSGARLSQWVNVFSSDAAVVGNRGPFISSDAKGRGPGVAPAFDPASNTLRIHGDPGTWEGNICYNDNHSNFETSLWGSDGASYTDAGGVKWHDLFHYDEPDDASGLNRYLGIFTVAGPMPSAFNAIWD